MSSRGRHPYSAGRPSRWASYISSFSSYFYILIIIIKFMNNVTNPHTLILCTYVNFCPATTSVGKIINHKMFNHHSGSFLCVKCPCCDVNFWSLRMLPKSSKYIAVITHIQAYYTNLFLYSFIVLLVLNTKTTSGDCWQWHGYVYNLEV